MTARFSQLLALAILLAAVALVLAACGGGGDPVPEEAAAEPLLQQDAFCVCEAGWADRSSNAGIKELQ